MKKCTAYCNILSLWCIPMFMWFFSPLFFPLPLPLPTTAPPLSDHAYLQASAIFQQLREEKPVTHELLRYAKKTEPQLQESGDRATQRQAYQLAFNTLKCTIILWESSMWLMWSQRLRVMLAEPHILLRKDEHKVREKLICTAPLPPLQTPTTTYTAQQPYLYNE